MAQQSSIQSLAPLTTRGLHRGMVDETAVADVFVPATQMRRIINMDTDTIGFLTRCNGYTRLGDAAVITDNDMMGLHYHVSKVTSANTQIIAFLNDAADANVEAYYLSGTTWTNKNLDFTKDTKIRAVTFLDYVIVVNGTDSPKSWTGATGAAWGTTLLASAPTGALIETFRQQVYIGNTSTDTIYFSSVPTAGSISWTATDNFIVNPNDGSQLTALKRFGSQLLIFKNDYLYLWNGRSTQADPYIPFGTPVQEAVAVCGGVCWFFDGTRRAIYGYAGGYPELISKPVQAFLRAIPTSALTSVVLRGDEDHVEAFIGDVTVDNIAYTKVALRYTISSQTWTMRSYAHTFRNAVFYDDGTSRFIVAGTADGFVFKMDTGNLFHTTDISFEVETAWRSLGDNPAYISRLASFAAYVHNAAAITAQYRVNGDTSWSPIGETRQYVNTWSGINADFERIRFRFSGIASSNDPAVFEGYSMLLPLVEGVEKESERQT